jgi:5-bromo-4-chloroindolyl phosphate hydrolysis protein
MQENNPTSLVTILLWIGTAIAINTTISIWLVSRVAEGVPVTLFSEYRLATQEKVNEFKTLSQWRYEYINKQLDVINDRIESLRYDINILTKYVYSNDPKRDEREDFIPLKRKRDKPKLPYDKPNE